MFIYNWNLVQRNVFSIETKNGLTVHQICATAKEARSPYLESFNIETGGSNIPVEGFKEKLKNFRKCPSPLEGKDLNAGSYGTNPFMYNDREKKVIYGPDGVPEGSNGGIAKGLAKIHNMRLNIKTYSFGGTVNETTGNTTGAIRDVSIAFELLITQPKVRSCRRSIFGIPFKS